MQQGEEMSKANTCLPESKRSIEEGKFQLIPFETGLNLF
jgi:hypothetical protein